MTNFQHSEASAYSQFLATNLSKEADYAVCDLSGKVVAAKWQRPASRNAKQAAAAQHTLMYHVGGSTSVAKFVGGECVGTHAQYDSVTFSPRDECSEWVRGGVCEVMHVYIWPSDIQQYASENLASSDAPEIDPLFAIHDPWLQGYFSMLLSEFEVYGGNRKEPDALLLTQSTELGIRHLVRWHSNVSQKSQSRAAASVAPHPLAPRQLARVLAYMEANLNRDIGLADMAQIVGVSRDYFIRSFHAATQRTPYSYLVERRLALAVDALRYGTKSIEQIAHDSGFRSTPGFSNVFKKHLGVSPSKFRARSR